MIEVTLEPTVRIVHPKDSGVWVEVALANSVEEAISQAEMMKHVRIVGVVNQDGGTLMDERGQPVTARVPIIPTTSLEDMFAGRLRGWGGIYQNGVEVPFPDQVARKKNPKWWHILGAPALGFYRDVPIKNADGTPKIDPKTETQAMLKHQWTSYADYIFEKGQNAGPEEEEAQGNG